MKLSKCQSGFSHLVAALTLALVIGGVGSAGWKVYDSKKKPAAQSSQNTTQTDQVEPKSDESKVPEEITETVTINPFVSSEPKFSFVYPESWKVVKTTYTGENASTYLEITSPDLKYDESEGLGDICRNKITKGYKFSVYYANNKYTTKDIVKSIMEEDSNSVKNRKRTTLAGLPAVEYDQSPGECGYWHKVSVNHDDYLFTISGPQGYPELTGWTDKFDLITNSFNFQ